jgi:hypothetical protein
MSWALLSPGIIGGLALFLPILAAWLPGVRWIAQRIVDASGGGPRRLPAVTQVE